MSTKQELERIARRLDNLCAMSPDKAELAALTDTLKASGDALKAAIAATPPTFRGDLHG